MHGHFMLSRRAGFETEADGDLTPISWPTLYANQVIQRALMRPTAPDGARRLRARSVKERRVGADATKRVRIFKKRKDRGSARLSD